MVFPLGILIWYHTRRPSIATLVTRACFQVLAFVNIASASSGNWSMASHKHNLTTCFVLTNDIYCRAPLPGVRYYIIQTPCGKWSRHTLFNTLKPRQNCRHFPDDIFKRILLNENIWNWLKISLKFVPKGPIYNIPALVQIMAWRRPGDSLLTHKCVTRHQWVNSLAPERRGRNFQTHRTEY